MTRKTPHKGSIQALFGLKMRADTLLLNGSDANAMVMDLNAHRVEVGVVCYESDSKDTSGGVSLSLGKTLSVHGEWATHKRRTYVPTRQTAQFMRFGTPGHPVDELVIYGSQLKGVMGTGTIRKVILVDKADTHAQDGASWNASVSLKDLGKTGWDAVSSVGAGVKGGDSSKVVDGKAEFKCDGVEVLAIETITAETYDRRYGVNLTKHFTSAGDAAGAAAAYAPAYSGRLELGEDSVGFELPNVMFHEKTETTSEQITRRDAEQAALEAQRQREAAKKAAEAPQTRGRPTTERPVQPRASSVPRPSGAREMVEPSFSEARLNGAANRLTTAVKGEMAEAAGRRALDYARGDHLPTRLLGNRGIDDARVFYDPAGKINGIDIVVDIVITESKFATGGGFPKLARTTDGVQQLSPAWMKKQIDSLERTGMHPETLRILKENSDKIRFKANVQDEFGVNRWYDYGRYDPSNFKEFNAIRTPKITGGE
ncbi:hypothetical protein [Candidatus Bodocaedibacter vickermanii]|uniref:Uncharacterized protein n=1 Tax=Candidatus Bodocaedibacter vickermanii TaxID=2741701 RepID=A0A7L9RSQ5_9PROT|nr:hypothetical protein CPBP_00211 [Candidatus Paracaedibacteraceae bacterium 'Lake Konstanz']